MDVAGLLHGAKGFVGLIGPRVVRTGRDGARLRLDAGPELHNHVGGPHAAVIFGLGETAAFAVLLEVFGDLVEQGALPLVKSSRIAYAAVATGPLLADAALAGDETAARASYAERGVAVFDVEVVFRRESDGEPTATATYAMAVRRPR
jgi:acyl-coenzyme A thioesterase PaaI-like protein